jgi:AraC-like DNA-binding protein
MSEIIQIKSITEFHQLAGLPEPKHPLIGVYEDQEMHDQIRPEQIKYAGVKFSFHMYTIMFKDKIRGSMTYGRTSYDFQHGTLVFIAPGQVIETPEYESEEESHGWIMMFHPDLIRNSALEKNLDAYTFFNYETNEALHLAMDEQEYLSGVISQIKKEYSQNLDGHSHRLILSNIELLLNNCLRFYDRQFYTRSGFNKDFVSSFEKLLKEYYQADKSMELGIPAVSYFSDEMNMSANYLSDLLKKETGLSAKGHINKMIVEKAKSALLNPAVSVSEIAYSLGFEHPQSLTRLFKSKTGLTPNEYRNQEN